MKKVLGISGYIGSGKTFAGKYFESLGAFYIDADKIVNEIYKPGKDGYLKIVQFFGDQFLDEKELIDRSKLSEFVFGDSQKLKIVNKMIHPLVVNEIVKKVDKVNEGVVVVEAVYFDDDMLGKIVDEILWIECEISILRERALKRGMSEDLFMMIVKSQRKPERVDYQVENNSSNDEFETKLKEVWTLISKD